MKNCKSCGNELEMVAKPFTCDMTVMVYDAKVKDCGKCNRNYSHLPTHLQKKLEDLDYLEATSMALGLQDKIFYARQILNKEIQEFKKSKSFVN